MLVLPIIKQLYKSKWFLLIYCFILISTTLNAADDNKFAIEKCSRFNAGIIYSSYHFNGTNYSPGFFLQHNYCLKPSKYFGYGLGAGIMNYKKQRFLPVYFDFLACRESNFYGNIQMGYSFAWKSGEKYYPSYSFKGGIYSQAGVGYKFKLLNEYSSSLYLGYNLQFAQLHSSTLADKVLHFHSIVFTFGIMLETK
jgi:hypothetical protein